MRLICVCWTLEAVLLLPVVGRFILGVGGSYLIFAKTYLQQRDP